MYCSLLTHMKLKCKRWISRPFVLLTKFQVHIYTQATHLTQEMGSHANPLFGMLKVYFYIVPNFPSKPEKVCRRARDGAVVIAPASHQCDPGSNPGVDAICGLSLMLVLSFALRSFSPGTPVFPSPQKISFPNSHSTRNRVDEEPLCGCATSKSLVIYFIYV